MRVMVTGLFRLSVSISKILYRLYALLVHRNGKRQLAHVDTKTQDVFLPMYQLLVKRLERDHSNLNLSGASGETLCSTLAFCRALGVIIENLQAASSLEVSQRKKKDPFSLRGKHMT